MGRRGRCHDLERGAAPASRARRLSPHRTVHDRWRNQGLIRRKEGSATLSFRTLARRGNRELSLCADFVEKPLFLASAVVIGDSCGRGKVGPFLLR
jgi:hypothetical protein